MSKSFKIFLLVLLIAALAVFVMWRQGILSSIRLPFVSKTPKPGTCLLLEEQYCKDSSFVYPPEGGVPAIGFKTEKAEIFAPFDCVIGEVVGFSDEGFGGDSTFEAIFIIPSDEDISNPETSILIAGNFENNFVEYGQFNKGEPIATVVSGTMGKFGDYSALIIVSSKTQSGLVASNTSLYLETILTNP
jgi:hypothetical protein